MAMRNYLDFAENDYQYFQSSYNAGIVANAMAVDAQEICEKSAIVKYADESRDELTEIQLEAW